MALTKEQLIDEIKQMSVIQLSEIVKALEEEFGVSAAAAVAAAPAAAAGGDAAAGAAEEKDEFTVNITSAGDNKIAAIKAVREVTDLGLKEAKALVESAPSAVKEGVSKEEAEKIKASLEAAGLKVELA